MKKSSKILSKNIVLVYGISYSVYFGLFTIGGFILTENLIISLVFAMVFALYGAYEYKKKYEKKQLAKIEKQFLESFMFVLTSICAGRSMEQAFVELSETIKREGRKKYGLVWREIERINKKTSMNFNFYDELLEFGIRSGSSDILNTVKALKIVGVKGGSVSFILRNSLSVLRVKLETDSEIKQTLSLPVYNQKIITVMPFGLVLMIKGISKEYISVLYTTKTGLIVVTGVAVAMFFAWLLGNKLCKIDI